MRGSKRERRPGVWELIVPLGRDHTGRRITHSETFRGGARDADSALAALVAKHSKTRSRSGGNASGRTMTFGDLLDLHMEDVDRTKAETTARGYHAYVDGHLKPALGRVRLDKLTARDFDLLFGECSRNGMAPSSVKQMRAIAGGALKKAIRWGWIDSNPARLAETDPVKSRPQTMPTVDEFKRLANVVLDSDPDMARLLWVAIALGARRGELCGLRWRHVNLDGSTVRVERNVVVVQRRGDQPRRLVDKTTKTDQARDVEIDHLTADILRGHLEDVTERLRLACGPRVKLSKDAYVFSRDPRGREPLDPQRVSDAWQDARAAVHAAEVEAWEQGGRRGDRPARPEWRLHDLRHLSASLLLAAGIPVTTVSRRLGHRNASTTLNIYAHALPRDGQAAANVLGGLLHGEPAKELGA